MQGEIKKEPVAVGAAADKEDPEGSPYKYYYSRKNDSCQALITAITELADDIIGDETTDAEVCGYAGMIKGLAFALRELTGGGK